MPPSSPRSYLGWTWDTWDCSAGRALTTFYDGSMGGTRLDEPVVGIA